MGEPEDATGRQAGDQVEGEMSDPDPLPPEQPEQPDDREDGVEGAGDPTPPADDGRDVRSICGARTRDGGICPTPPVIGASRCRMHGGRSPRGLKSASFKHGRYSAELQRVTDDLQHRLDDPGLVDPRRSIAVQEVVLAKCYAMLADKDSPEFRAKAVALHGEAMETLREDAEAGVKVLRRLGNFLERGSEESKTLGALSEAADAMNRAQTRFWKVALSAGRSIPPEEFVGLMLRLVDIIKHEVDDPDAARRILERADREVCGGALGVSAAIADASARDPRASGAGDARA